MKLLGRQTVVSPKMSTRRLQHILTKTSVYWVVSLVRKLLTFSLFFLGVFSVNLILFSFLEFVAISELNQFFYIKLFLGYAKNE